MRGRLNYGLNSDIVIYDKGVVGTVCGDANILDYILVSSEMTRLICRMQMRSRFFI